MNQEQQTDDSALPLIAKVLGYAGIIPFIALSLCIATGTDLSSFGVSALEDKLLSYAAVIISFIGAVHWGVALRSESSKQEPLFIYSVIPALAAWTWLFCPFTVALVGMAATVVVMYFIDRFVLHGLVPGGYLKMRLHLTVIVTTSLLVAAF